ncbi:UbiA family prenyltransferase [Herbidospora mongoliensis]|uniref:UbiA family prenyltransferase n=1 Tax=Herbidospora mongoliensis TaxID=688067 RepID=UPI001FDF8D64|nr:UbiA family prenyltransferase [Herbidospora mongoliensis]
MLLGLLRACHPGPTLAVTALVTALAVGSGQNLVGCLFVAAAVLTGQLSVGWSNDAVDAGRDRALGRTEKPAVSGLITTRALWVGAGLALAACVPLSLLSGLAAGGFHLLGVAAAWSYNLGLKATVLSWVPYVIGFGQFPAFVSLGLPGEPWPAWWSVLAGALLGVGAHLANVLPDIDGDLKTGVHGLPQRLGPRRTRVLTAVFLVAAVAVLWWPAVVVAFGLALAPRYVRRPDAPLLSAIAVAALAVVLLLVRGTG